MHVKIAGDSGGIRTSKNSHNVMRWYKADTSLFCHITRQLLQNVHVSQKLIMSNCTGLQCDYQLSVNAYYENIINVLTYAANLSVPRLSANTCKPYWSSELQQLKEDSMQAHRT